MTVMRLPYFCHRSTASAGSLAIVKVPTKGNCVSADFSGPRRNSRTTEWAPSAPMSKSPVADVPSSNSAVAVFPSEEIRLTFLLYYSL